MFASLNLEGTTTVVADVWGNPVTLDRVAFRCGCQVEGYQHQASFLVTGGRPCYSHRADGRDPVTVDLEAPRLDLKAEHHSHYCNAAFSWVEGFEAGYYRGRKWEGREARPFGPSPLEVA